MSDWVPRQDDFEGIVSYLDRKLDHAPFKSDLYRNKATGEFSMRIYPMAAVRGNSVYANREAARREAAVKDIDLDSGRCLFVTLTVSYDPSNPVKSWYAVKGELSKLNRRMRSLGMVEMVRAVEANAGGGCHVHLLAKMNRAMPWFLGWDKKRECEVYRLGDRELHGRIKKAWPLGWLDIQVVKDTGVGGYVLKELSKFSSYEESLRRFKKGTAGKADIQRLLTHYYADKSKSRLFTVSKGLRKKVDGLSECALINNKIKSTSSPDGESELELIASVVWPRWPGGRGGKTVPGYGVFRPGDEVFERVWSRALENVRPPGDPVPGEMVGYRYLSKV